MLYQTLPPLMKELGRETSILLHKLYKYCTLQIVKCSPLKIFVKLNIRNISCNGPVPILVAKVWRQNLDCAKNLQAKYFFGKNILIYSTSFQFCNYCNQCHIDQHSAPQMQLHAADIQQPHVFQVAQVKEIEADGCSAKKYSNNNIISQLYMTANLCTKFFLHK